MGATNGKRGIGPTATEAKHVGCRLPTKTDKIRVVAEQADRQQQLPYGEGFDGSQSITITAAILASHPSAWK